MSSEVLRIGVDEAGYGPNLGPLVMSATACRVPSEHADADLWTLLADGATRVRKGKPAQLLVDDSKKVYRSGQGLAELERTVLSIVAPDRPTTLGALVKRLGATMPPERWFHGDTALPHSAPLDKIDEGADRFRRASEKAGIVWRPLRSRVVGIARFNEIVDRYDSKGAVLGLTLIELLREVVEAEPTATDIRVVVDKHGGRNFYGPLLQELSPDAWVVPREEGMRSSVYDIRWPTPTGGERRLTVAFRPEADATSFEVALASVVSKYLRELCMEEFNAFWRTQVPGIVATAGYPVDAIRFIKEIRPSMDRLAVSMDSIWRKK